MPERSDFFFFIACSRSLTTVKTDVEILYMPVRYTFYNVCF